MAKRVFSQTFCVVGAIVERDGKILLAKEAGRKDDDAGKWNQPAGWLDVGEDPIAGAKREVEEETGLSFEPTHVLGIYSLVRDDLTRSLDGTPHAIKILLRGTVGGKQGALHDDVSETKWFTPAEIDAMDQSQLRDIDIKQEVKDYFAGKRYPLDLVEHVVQSSR